MLRKFALLSLVAVLVLAFGVSMVAAQGEPLKIGLMTDQSGALTIYGYELEFGFKLGLLYSAGIDPTEFESIDAALATLTIGDRPVEILVRDNGGDPDTATSQARELIEQEGVEILVGAPSSGVTVALQQVALDYDVVLFAAPGASPAITGANFNINTFRVCRNTYQDFLSFVPYAQENLGTNFVIFAADYEFGRASAGAAQAVLGAGGINFVQEPIFAPLETTDFTTYIQQILDSGADAVLPIWAGDTSVTLFQQLDELGVKDQMAVVAAFNSNDIVALSDPSNIGNVSWIVYQYALPQNEINDWLVEKHQAVYSDVPDLFTECGFATAQALSSAVSSTSGDTLPASLIPALEGLQFDGPKGTYIIRPGDHQALVPMYIVQLANLDDPDQKFYTLLQEVPALDIIPPCEAGEERCALNEEFLASLEASS
ncbi:MAG: substrate-binding domain-containing protein [Chloroflexi bacterium]|nr:substrate-binding domain-containing protein [Chloroflexota bacterium]